MSGPYRIRIERRALKVLTALPNRDRNRIKKAIDALAAEPRPPGVRKLSDQEQLYRIRVGNYRVVYQVQDKVFLVLIVKVGHRKDIYR